MNIMSRPLAGQPRNLVSIPGNGKRLPSPSKRPNRLFGPTQRTPTCDIDGFFLGGISGPPFWNRQNVFVAWDSTVTVFNCPWNVNNVVISVSLSIVNGGTGGAPVDFARLRT